MVCTMLRLGEKLKKIVLAIFDIDGVFTDGKLYLSNSGEEMRSFHLHDGLGIKLLLKQGIEVAVITAKQSETVKLRCQSLGIQHIYQGYERKEPAYQELLQTLQLSSEVVCYTGDDLPDLPLIKCSGVGIAVANAQAVLKEYADYVTHKAGGEGAVREVCDLILKAKSIYYSAIDNYLE